MSKQLNSEAAREPASAPAQAMWPTSTGVWTPRTDGTGYVLVTTVLGNTAAAFSPLDVLHLQSARRSGADPHAIYPQEFTYCPLTGEPLMQPVDGSNDCWIAPTGSVAMNVSWHLPRGLKQTSRSFVLSRRSARHAHDNHDRAMPLPPLGRHEFFSVPAGTQMPVLLAIDPTQGLFYAWLPGSNAWKAIQHQGEGRLAESSLDRDVWRCEASIQGAVTTVFLPTCEGLARLNPDVPSLCFMVDYLGDGPAVGAPIAFDSQVWMPVAQADGIALLAASAEGRADTLLLNVPPVSLGKLRQPVADGRLAIWPCDAGQLLVQKLANGEKQVSLLPWPEGIQPAFEFGSPYLSGDGSLWQLCLDLHEDTYVYLELGKLNAARQGVPVPRMCTGRMAMRFTTRLKNEVWREPEYGDDTRSDEWLIPIVESAVDGAVLGLKLQATAGAADVLRDVARQRAVLVCDDDQGAVEFGTLVISHPWQTQALVHDGALWIYHPQLEQLTGWELA